MVIDKTTPAPIQLSLFFSSSTCRLHIWCHKGLSFSLYIYTWLSFLYWNQKKNDCQSWKTDHSFFKPALHIQHSLCAQQKWLIFQPIGVKTEYTNIPCGNKLKVTPVEVEMPSPLTSLTGGSTGKIHTETGMFQLIRTMKASISTLANESRTCATNNYQIVEFQHYRSIARWLGSTDTVIPLSLSHNSLQKVVSTPVQQFADHLSTAV